MAHLEICPGLTAHHVKLTVALILLTVERDSPKSMLHGACLALCAAIRLDAQQLEPLRNLFGSRLDALIRSHVSACADKALAALAPEIDAEAEQFVRETLAGAVATAPAAPQNRKDRR